MIYNAFTTSLQTITTSFKRDANSHIQPKRLCMIIDAIYVLALFIAKTASDYGTSKSVVQRRAELLLVKILLNDDGIDNEDAVINIIARSAWYHSDLIKYLRNSSTIYATYSDNLPDDLKNVPQRLNNVLKLYKAKQKIYNENKIKAELNVEYGIVI